MDENSNMGSQKKILLWGFLIAAVSLAGLLGRRHIEISVLDSARPKERVDTVSGDFFRIHLALADFAERNDGRMPEDLLELLRDGQLEEDALFASESRGPGPDTG